MVYDGVGCALACIVDTIVGIRFYVSKTVHFGTAKKATFGDSGIQMLNRMVLDDALFTRHFRDLKNKKYQGKKKITNDLRRVILNSFQNK